MYTLYTMSYATALTLHRHTAWLFHTLDSLFAWPGTLRFRGEGTEIGKMAKPCWTPCNLSWSSPEGLGGSLAQMSLA